MPALENPKHERTVQNRIKGMSQREAYKDGFGVNYSNDAIDNKASKFFARGEVQARYNELMKELQDEAIMSAKERMKWLTEVVQNKQTEETNNGNIKTADLNTKIKAIDTLNKMDNAYQQNINIKGTINDPFEEVFQNMDADELRETIERLKNE